MLRQQHGVLALVMCAAVMFASAELAASEETQLGALLQKGDQLMASWEDPDAAVEVLVEEEAPQPSKVDSQYDQIFGHSPAALPKQRTPPSAGNAKTFNFEKLTAVATKPTQKAPPTAQEQKLAKQREEDLRVNKGLDLAQKLLGTKKMPVDRMQVPVVTPRPPTKEEQKAASKAKMKAGLALARQLLNPKKEHVDEPISAGVNHQLMETAERVVPEHLLHSQQQQQEEQQQQEQQQPSPLKAAVEASSHPKVTEVQSATGTVSIVPFKKVQTKWGERVLPPVVHMPRPPQGSDRDEEKMAAMDTARKAAADLARAKAAEKAAEAAKQAEATKQQNQAKWTEEDYAAQRNNVLKKNKFFKHAAMAGAFDKKRKPKAKPKSSSDMYRDMLGESDAGASLLKEAGLGDQLADEYKHHAFHINTDDLLLD